MKNFFKLIVSIAVAELAGVVGAIFSIPSIPTWYANLVKPAISLPNSIFAPVWTTLYTLMGIAAFLVWNKGSDRPDVRKALSVFGFQLVINAIWSFVFFGLRDLAWAFAVIVILWLAIVWTMSLFSKISKPAFYLLVPYILWVSFAAYLNFSLWMLNR